MEQPYILLVEDNPDDRDLSLRALKRRGKKVMIANNGGEALDHLLGKSDCVTGEPANLPSIIILDLKMPEVDGFEVIKTVRSDPRTEIIPIVVFTSSEEATDIVISYKLGANSYVRKPVDYKEFSKALGELEHYWAHLNEPAPQEDDLSELTTKDLSS